MLITMEKKLTQLFTGVNLITDEIESKQLGSVDAWSNFPFKESQVRIFLRNENIKYVEDNQGVYLTLESKSAENLCKQLVSTIEHIKVLMNLALTEKLKDSAYYKEQ